MSVMGKFLVLKEQSARGKLRSAVVVDLANKNYKANKLCVTGNLPELYQGMFIELTLDRAENKKTSFVTNYKVDFDEEKTIAALKKAEVDVSTYRQTVENHERFKDEGISFKDVSKGIENIYGIKSFPQADRIHSEAVGDPLDPVRLKAIVNEIFTISRKQFISFDMDSYLDLFEKVQQQGAYEPLSIADMVNVLAMDCFEIKDLLIWDRELKEKEDFVKSNISERANAEYRLLSGNEVERYKTLIEGQGLEEEQIDVLDCLTTSAPSVITGGAGTGKTTVIKNIIECYDYYYTNSEILLIAPTGKASRRLAYKTGLPASTIHKALRKTPEDDFVYYHENNPLPHRLIIVDEASMIDTQLMYDLLSAIDKHSKVIFVGDHNQLYPVGYGEPFFDFLKELDVYELVKNHRQEENSDILAQADNVLNDKMLEDGRGVNIWNICTNDIRYMLENEFPIEQRESTQILSPFNEFNHRVNMMCKRGTDDLNINDKVILVTNTNDYCNGDIGFITDITADGIEIRIDDRKVFVEPNHYDDIRLAYAITIHKMQGSEADRVIVFLPKGREPDRRMLYTAVTRARKQLDVFYYYHPYPQG